MTSQAGETPKEELIAPGEVVPMVRMSFRRSIADFRHGPGTVCFPTIPRCSNRRAGRYPQALCGRSEDVAHPGSGGGWIHHRLHRKHRCDRRCLSLTVSIVHPTELPSIRVEARSGGGIPEV